MNGIQIAKGRGWFSLGLGLVEMAAPGRMAHGLVLPVSPVVVGLLGMRNVGARMAFPDRPGEPNCPATTLVSNVEAAMLPTGRQHALGGKARLG